MHTVSGSEAVKLQPDDSRAGDPKKRLGQQDVADAPGGRRRQQSNSTVTDSSGSALRGTERSRCLCETPAALFAAKAKCD